jgi:hypothetical protein
MRQRRWEPPETPPPKHPYRDTAIFHLVLSGLIVVVAFLTAGDLIRAFIFAGAFFVLATAWSWSRWRRQLAEEARRAAQRAPARARSGKDGS